MKKRLPLVLVDFRYQGMKLVKIHVSNILKKRKFTFSEIFNKKTIKDKSFYMFYNLAVPKKCLSPYTQEAIFTEWKTILLPEILTCGGFTLFRSMKLKRYSKEEKNVKEQERNLEEENELKNCLWSVHYFFSISAGRANRVVRQGKTSLIID